MLIVSSILIIINLLYAGFTLGTAYWASNFGTDAKTVREVWRSTVRLWPGSILINLDRLIELFDIIAGKDYPKKNL